MPIKTLILDAMGVIYESGDDVDELLVPFLNKNGLDDTTSIESLYNDASLGKLKSSEFWESLNISPTLEDEYLSMHGLVPGLTEFLNKATGKVSSIWCLSNDISEWSKKLRSNFEIEDFFEGFIISGDVGIRKPDFGIYEKFLEKSKNASNECLFVDDREKNLDAAKDLGFQTILFDMNSRINHSKHKIINSYTELYDLL